MANRVPSHVRWQILYLVSAFFIHALIVYWAVTRQQARLHLENGWLENLQVLYLALAALGFGLSGKVLTGRHSSLFYLLSIVSLLFIIREVEFGDLAIPVWMKFMLAGAGRALFYIIAMVLLLQQARQFREYWDKRHVYLRSSLFWYLVASGFFLIFFSLTFDRQFFDIPHYQLFEEIAEAIAYLFLLGAAMFGYAGVKRNYALRSNKASARSDSVEMESLLPFFARLRQSQKHNR